VSGLTPTRFANPATSSTPLWRRGAHGTEAKPWTPLQVRRLSPVDFDLVVLVTALANSRMMSAATALNLAGGTMVVWLATGCGWRRGCRWR
jgi:hypothetical protein